MSDLDLERIRQNVGPGPYVSGSVFNDVWLLIFEVERLREIYASNGNIIRDRLRSEVTEQQWKRKESQIEYEALSAALGDLESRLARVTALHKPVVLHKGAGADHFVTVTVCSECGGSDAWFDDTSQAIGAAAYPCPTVRAAVGTTTPEPEQR